MATAATWTPEPDQVAAIIPQRTGDRSGRAQGSWSPDTVPTVAQVKDIITDYVGIVVGLVGTVDDRLVDLAKGTVAMGAAAQVELSFYPDQSLTAQSPADQLYLRYQDRLKALVKSQSDLARAGTLGGQDDVPSAGWEMPSPAPASQGGTDPISWYTDF